MEPAFTPVFELVKISPLSILGTHGLSLLLPCGEKGGMRGLRRRDTEI
jgi:hypothetical protein